MCSSRLPCPSLSLSSFICRRDCVVIPWSVLRARVGWHVSRVLPMCPSVPQSWTWLGLAGCFRGGRVPPAACSSRRSRPPIKSRLLRLSFSCMFIVTVYFKTIPSSKKRTSKNISKNSCVPFVQGPHAHFPLGGTPVPVTCSVRWAQFRATHWPVFNVEILGLFLGICSLDTFESCQMPLNSDLSDVSSRGNESYAFWLENHRFLLRAPYWGGGDAGWFVQAGGISVALLITMLSARSPHYEVTSPSLYLVSLLGGDTLKPCKIQLPAPLSWVLVPLSVYCFN